MRRIELTYGAARRVRFMSDDEIEALIIKALDDYDRSRERARRYVSSVVGTWIVEVE